jgi:hypothetical protein
MDAAADQAVSSHIAALPAALAAALRQAPPYRCPAPYTPKHRKPTWYLGVNVQLLLLHYLLCLFAISVRTGTAFWRDPHHRQKQFHLYPNTPDHIYTIPGTKTAFCPTNQPVQNPENNRKQVDKFPKRILFVTNKQAKSEITANHMVLKWTANDGSLATELISLTKTNIPISRSTPSFHHFKSFVANIFKDLTKFTFPVISNTKDSDSDTVSSTVDLPKPPPEPPPRNTIVHTNFTIKSPITLGTGDDQPLLHDMMSYHERLGYLPLEQFMVLTTRNLIPKKLAKCLRPVCH